MNSKLNFFFKKLQTTGCPNNVALTIPRILKIVELVAYQLQWALEDTRHDRRPNDVAK